MANIYTNGDFKVDIGYPKTSDDWSRSCLIQINSAPPFVGWAGFYFAKLRTASLSLFADYEKKYPVELSDCNILQAGFAFRVGIGAYIDKGTFYVGASISVYGILEGAFAFKNKGGLAKFIPDHFALRGRVGAIAELIGYVDFKIIKASIHILLRVEFGMLLVVINTNANGHQLQPVPLYIEGAVSVDIDFTIACFKIFGHRICITIHLSFSAFVRFAYTIGGDSNKMLSLSEQKSNLLADEPIKIQFGEIPIIYIPGVTKTNEDGGKNYLIHHFAINFFGYKYDAADASKLCFPKNNVLKDNIIKPIFTAILGTEKQSYDSLRHVFLEGINGSHIDFDVTLYKPTLFVGYNETDIEFLNQNYGLNDDEIREFAESIKDDPCANNKPCPFRPIPIPITSNIKVVSKDGTRFETDSSGFDIKLTGLFKDEAGNAVDILKTINKTNEYTVENIKTIEEYFDGYMTQFLERGKNKSKVASFNDKDLREDAILPEYFKLIGLLTLETCYNEFLQNIDKTQINTVNPVVSIKEIATADPLKPDYIFIFTYDKQTIQTDGSTLIKSIPIEIKPNDVLEKNHCTT